MRAVQRLPVDCGMGMDVYDDRNSSCAETFATFRLSKEDLNPDDVSRLLGLEPSRVQRKGEPQYPKNPDSPLRFRSGGWHLSTQGHVESRDLRRHVDWLLERLEPKRDVLLRLSREGCAMDLICFWCSASGQGGPWLDAALMRRLADLALAIRFDVYFRGPADGPDA